MDVRLLAPRAELRLQVAGGSSMIDAGRLSYLGEALRALLVIEVRKGRVQQQFRHIDVPLTTPCRQVRQTTCTNVCEGTITPWSCTQQDRHDMRWYVVVLACCTSSSSVGTLPACSCSKS
eukprot:GHUV01049025.1.p2 GENE.GHUV01049025.1~~GHUV01049025.1.p2  ORF type:complete len:120 (+),score=26.38 GHUV01049025.1:183-542(+)